MDTEHSSHPLLAAVARLERDGFLPATFGNVSVRRPDGAIVVTPSAVPWPQVREEDLVVVSTEGGVVGGHRLPSSETAIHLAIYRARADVHAVVHTHALHAAACATLHREIPVLLEEHAQIVGTRIPTAPYVRAGRHSELALAASATLGPRRAALLANHGTVACGRDLADAELVARTVDRACRTYLLAAALGPVEIPPDDVAAEHARWGTAYGTAADLALGELS